MKKYTLLCVLAVLCAIPGLAQGGRYDSWVVDSLNRLVANPTIRVCPYTGPYKATTAYVTGNTVTFAGGYYTAAANSTNSPPSTNPTLWTAGNCPTTGVLLYADKDLTFSQPNPFLGDSHGNYGFFAAAGSYVVQANGYAYYVTISPADAATKSYVTSATLAVPKVDIPGLNSFGDSITCGFLATTGYPSLLISAVGGTLNNLCRNGDMTADASRLWVHTINPGHAQQPTTTYALGINDSTSYGSNTDKQQITQTQAMESLAWLAIPDTFKTFGQSGAVTKTGTWTNDDAIRAGLGTQSTVQGSTASMSIITAGAPIYVAYRIFDGGTGTASLTIDGTVVGTLNAYGFNHALISTTNGTTDSVSVFRYPVTAGTHTVSIAVTSASGTFSFQWAGTAASGLLQYAPPQVFVGSVTRELADANEPLNGQYNTLMNGVVNTLVSDGLRLTWVDTRSYLNTSTDLADLKHPNDTGQGHMRDAFLAAMQPVSPVSTSNFTTPVTVNAAAASSMANFSNFNLGNQFSQTLLNPGYLLYKGTGREMGGTIGSNHWPNPAYQLFAPDNGYIDFCHHLGGTSPTQQSDMTCNLSYAYNGGAGMLTVSNLTVTGSATIPSSGTFSGTAYTPATAGGAQLGDSTHPWSGAQLGTSSTNRVNQTVAVSAARAMVWRDIGSADTPNHNITANTTSALSTSAIAAGACAVTTVASASVTTADVIQWAFNGAPSSTYNNLEIRPYATAGNVNFQVCNPTTGSITPAATSLNWKVSR